MMEETMHTAYSYLDLGPRMSRRGARLQVRIGVGAKQRSAAQHETRKNTHAAQHANPANCKQANGNFR